MSSFSKSGSKRSSRISRKMRKIKVTFDNKHEDDILHEEEEDEKPMASVKDQVSSSKASIEAGLLQAVQNDNKTE